MSKVKLSPPWVIFYDEVKALFGRDDDIKIVYNEDEQIIDMYISNQEKAEALTLLLPLEKKFGNVSVKINVIPANDNITFHKKLFTKSGSLYEKAFCGNPAFSYYKEISGIFSNNLHYVVFVNEVVQYFNDSLSDIHGLCSTLYQDIAKDIFEDTEGIFFCTDLPNSQLKGLTVNSSNLVKDDWVPF